MGSVWVAYHHRLQIRVAVKFVSEKLAGEDINEAVARFEREASTAAQIKSQHVIQTFDSGVTNEGAPYMVMELLDGESLGDRLRRTGRLEMIEAAPIVAQVARALSKAHELGIVHRDIKPDNIYLCASEEGVFCKILDFGIAKQTQLPAMGGLTTEGKLVGTPEYMSPEQVLEEGDVGYRADLWALGVVMYVSLTGKLPYEGKTLGQLCLNLVSAKPAPPSSLRPDLGPSVDAWFARALARKADQRFSTAKELAATFIACVPEEQLATAGIDLGGLTQMTLRENTERNFGAAASRIVTLPPGRKLATPLLAAVVAIGVALLGAAGFVLSTDTSSLSSTPLIAEATLGQSAMRAAAEATEATRRTATSEPINLDDVDVPDDESGDRPSGQGRAWTPPVRPGKADPPDKSASPPAATDKPGDEPPPATPPPAPPPASTRRGKQELGF